MEVLPVPNQFNVAFGNDKANPWNLTSCPSSSDVAQLSRRLEMELRAVKSDLACAEVLLPATLLPRVASEALTLADCEPCGARGCTLFIQLEGSQECRRIATVKLDDSTVSTFELHLTLKHAPGSWSNLLPQFLKNLARGGGTIVISPQFTLTKKEAVPFVSAGVKPAVLNSQATIVIITHHHLRTAAFQHLISHSADDAR